MTQPEFEKEMESGVTLIASAFEDLEGAWESYQGRDYTSAREMMQSLKKTAECFEIWMEENQAELEEWASDEADYMASIYGPGPGFRL